MRKSMTKARRKEAKQANLKTERKTVGCSRTEASMDAWFSLPARMVVEPRRREFVLAGAVGWMTDEEKSMDLMSFSIGGRSVPKAGWLLFALALWSSGIPLSFSPFGNGFMGRVTSPSKF